MAFGRRKSQDQSVDEPESVGSHRKPDATAETTADDDVDGPFDIEDFDESTVATEGRLDLGSVLVPLPEAAQLQVELTENGVPSAVWVVTPNGRFTIAAYAAPKTAGLWREVASELAESLRKDSAQVSIKDGPLRSNATRVASAISSGPSTRQDGTPFDFASAWKSTCAVKSTSPGSCSGLTKEWRPTA